VPDNLKSLSTTEVIGNITLITSLGQNWYQQGIYGPNASGNASIDKSWGWTFFDETPASGFMEPPENTTQRNNIYALLLDSGNNSSPISGADVKANVTYWEFDGENYTNKTIQISLIENVNHIGFYSGNFSFYGGTPYYAYGMDWCDGCHLSYYTYLKDSKTGYFPGNYTVSISASVNSKIADKKIDFEVTPWGCENCHGSGNQHRLNRNQIIGVDMDSACYLCHSINQITHDGTDAGNPHQNTAHRDIGCQDCHTNKSLNYGTFKNVTFNKGGIDNNRYVPEYNFTETQLNGGKHTNLTCNDCHGDLSLPAVQGNYKLDNYTIQSTINNYNPDFATIQQFQDYYIINVTSGGPLNVALDWDSASNIGYYLYPPNFHPANRSNPLNPDEGDYPYYNGATFTNKPENYRNNTPLQGNWILAVYGYDLLSYWVGVYKEPFNYTINSTYPIQKEALPKIPECNNCHNSNGAGKAYTTDNIPDWNPGFAHVDTNNDSAPDIQCRLCHDALHEITVKNCQTCHTTAPVNHPVKEPDFSQKTSAQCLECHGDPHQVTSAGGTDCIACHSPNDVNITKFGRHADINKSDEPGIVTNNDCWTCHYLKDMNRINVYLCESCHINETGVVNVTDPSLIKSDFMHGMTTCRTCHAPSGYHQKGEVGPLGLVEIILKKMN